VPDWSGRGNHCRFISAAVKQMYRHIRNNWNTSDTVVLSVNALAFLAFIGNAWWESVAVCYAATAVPLGFQALWALRRHGTLGWVLLFGAFVAVLWPVGEGVVVRGLGWWGRYLAPGPRLWDTPLYCVLIGWLASGYCAYVGCRAVELGYAPRRAMAVSGLSAFAVGALGENLFVGARMWEYYPSTLDLGSVPAFVPVAYGLAYALVPALRPRGLVAASLGLSVVLLCWSVLLGLAVGFFPR